jgi:TonB family protein
MKAPGIYSALTFSFFLHILVITLSFYIGRGFFARKPIAPYIVSLVNPTQTAGSEQGSQSRGAPEAAEQESKRAQEIERPAEKTRVEVHTEPRHKNKVDTTIVKDRIEELKAKQKLEKLVALRKIVDIGARGRALLSKKSSGAGQRDNKTGSGAAGSGSGDYYSLVEGKIRQQWIFPETLDRDLETVVSIRIAKDGGITIEKVEQSSGSPLFDRSVLRAITMAGPLPPPLNEMEIGLRFRP